jgi:geranylgeranyl pyrophosphate synthase
VDDLLDVIGSSETLGKPAAVDLKLGLATAPVLYAMQEHPELATLISRKFEEEGDVQKVYFIQMNFVAH